jgi:hypothetical protein|tara:strand:+ start:370 stop:582 length:213 start_codon:yes stop_codon:yes gene_type:complete
MFKFFVKHLKSKSVSYSAHGRLAATIGTRLALSSIAFFLHAIFPFVKIPNCLNLEAMSLFLFDKNVEIED